MKIRFYNNQNCNRYDSLTAAKKKEVNYYYPDPAGFN